MIILFFRNYVCFGGECCKAIVSWCEGECSHITAVKGDSLFVLVLPCQLYMVVLGNAGVAVLAALV